MKHNKKRLMKIIDELTMYLFSLGATDIGIHIEDRETDYKIIIKSNYSVDKKQKIDQLVQGLNCPMNEEIEEYYWELLGESDTGNEIHLIGMMINEAEVKIDDHRIEMCLYKNK